MNIRLRDVEAGDLPALFAMQQDAEGNRLAAVIPRQSDAFHTHWEAVFADPRVVAKAILADESMVGQIGCFPADGQDMVGYWITREHWGRGIATRALALLLAEVSIRPLYARVARHNVASIRVLERCGFAIIGFQESPATGRFLACEEAILRLDSLRDGTPPTSPDVKPPPAPATGGTAPPA